MRSLQDMAMSVYLWIVLSLLAIAMIGDQPELGLLIATLGGVCVGLNGIAFQERRRSETQRGNGGGDGETGRWEDGGGTPYSQTPAEAKQRAGLLMLLRNLALRLAAIEIWLTFGLAALLILPNRFSPLALALIPVLWLLRWAATGKLTVRTGMEIPTLGLVVMLPVSLWASADLSRSWPSLYQIAAGIALLYALANTLNTRARVLQMGILFTLAGGGLALLSLVSTQWSAHKIFALPAIYQRLPALFPDVIHPNVLAGALVLAIPVGGALLLWPPFQLPYSRWVRLAAGGMTLVMLGVLALTQSRGAYIALAVGLLIFLLMLRRELAALAVVVGGIATFFIAQRADLGQILDVALTTDAVSGLAGRQEVWSRAIYMIQDFPYTGVGLGTFGLVARVLYPFFLVGPDTEVPHAHNLLLQVAVDVGLPGLVAFIALYTLALLMALLAYRRWRAAGDQAMQGLALGIAIGLVMMAVHGVVDAVVWGSKAAIVPWILFGLAVACYQVSAAPLLPGRSGQTDTTGGGSSLFPEVKP